MDGVLRPCCFLGGQALSPRGPSSAGGALRFTQTAKWSHDVATIGSLDQHIAWTFGFESADQDFHRLAAFKIGFANNRHTPVATRG